MAQSTIKKEIKTLDKTYSGQKTIPGNGYLKIEDITELKGKTVIGCVITTWINNNGAVALALGGGPALYIIGASGAYITGMGVRYTYLD